MRRLFAAAGRILAKPRLGSGARGIEVLTTAGAVDALLGRPAAQLAQLLVERFIDGAVLHLDAVVRDGRLLFSSLGRYEAPPLAFGSGAWSGTRFTNAASAVHDLARQKLRDLLQAWDVRDGVFHWEFFDTGSNLVFGEIAIRPPGGGVSRALYETFGVHLVQEHLRVQLGMASALDGAPLATAHGACLSTWPAAPAFSSDCPAAQPREERWPTWRCTSRRARPSRPRATAPTACWPVPCAPTAPGN